MPRAPRITGTALIAALGRAGFVDVRQNGSHHRLKHADGRVTSVPVHAGRIIGPGLLNQILADCKLTVEELLALL